MDLFASNRGDQLFSTAKHLLSSNGFRGLCAHFFTLSTQLFGFLQRDSSFFSASPLIFLTLFKVCSPAQMINIDMRAISVQVEHLIHSVTQQFHVVRDH